MSLFDRSSLRSFRASVQPAFDWLYDLIRNVYFWAGMGVLLGIGFGAYLVVDAAVMPAYTRHDVSVRVPNTENRPFEEAKKLLQKRGLQVERQEGRFNPNVDRGVVVDQKPRPNATVKPGRRIYLTVNAGEVPTVQLPDLNGMSVREAKNRLLSLGLEVGTVQPDSIPSPYANTITRQRPAPGDSLKKGETVNLWYSTGLGETTVSVPNVVGRTLDEARDLLLRRNLRSLVVDTSSADTQGDAEDDETIPADQVYVRRQDRSPGSSVRTGTEIRLFTTTDSTAVPDPDAASADTSDAGK